MVTRMSRTFFLDLWEAALQFLFSEPADATVESMRGPSAAASQTNRESMGCFGSSRYQTTCPVKSVLSAVPFNCNQHCDRAEPCGIIRG